jgi:hypothetical protein
MRSVLRVLLLFLTYPFLVLSALILAGMVGKEGSRRYCGAVRCSFPARVARPRKTVMSIVSGMKCVEPSA